MLLSGATPELPEANYSPVFRPQGFQGRSLPHFPKRINLLFSAPKILTAVFLIWGNPKKPPFRQVFLLCYFQGSPHTSQSKLPSCFPFPKFLPPFFFDLGQPEKTAFPSSFPLMLLSGVATHFPKRITLLFSAPKILTAVFLIWGNLEKKPPFRQVFLLCYFRGRPRFSSGVAPMNFPKQITPCVFR